MTIDPTSTTYGGLTEAFDFPHQAVRPMSEATMDTEAYQSFLEWSGHTGDEPIKAYEVLVNRRAYGTFEGPSASAVLWQVNERLGMRACDVNILVREKTA